VNHTQPVPFQTFIRRLIGALGCGAILMSGLATGHGVEPEAKGQKAAPAEAGKPSGPHTQPEQPVSQRTGAQIYAKMCASCHGDKGQGVPDKYDEPLHGNRSLLALTKRIAKTMPDDDVGSCVGADAANVASYIFDSFYSPQAQARLHPPEFDLSRLTIAQYRTSVADLVGRFRPGFDKPPGTERGLRAHYSGLTVLSPEEKKAFEDAEKDQKKKDKKNRPRTQFDRTDSQVAFHFDAASPDPQKMDNEEFSIRWEGSVIAEETGTYEFIVKTENGVRLAVNDTKNLLIDAWVSSGPDVKELKKSVFLLGGRSYSLVLEFFKFKDKTASVELQWKTPHGVVETIPQASLSPDRLRETMVVKTTFPADDRSVGYERGTGVSKEWDQATTDAALEVMEHVDAHLDELAGSKSGAADRVDKLKQFARKFVETAFRRPLSDESYKRYVEHQFAAAKSPEIAIKRAVLLALKSPRFLYPEIPQDTAPDSYQVASRLALNLWDSIPDAKLLQAAAEKKLQTRDQIAAQVGRMMTDPRTKAKLHGFYHYWLELERAEGLQKDPKAFPGFDAQVLADLRTSLFLFLDQVVWSDRSDYRELLQANYLLLNKRLAKFYGKEVADDGFERVDFDPKQRAGVVTHPYLLAAFASSKSTSPVHRGVFLTRTIVGMTLKPPPMAISFDEAKFDTHLTMREKLTEMTKNDNCMACHGTINPLGFSLENYDAIGRWRTEDNHKPINAVSNFSTDEGDTIRLTGPRDLVKFAAETPSGHRAFIHLLFHHTVKQEVNVYGPDTLENLRQSFTSSGFSVRKLLGDIAIVSAMRGLPEAEAKTAALRSPLQLARKN
jgi:mono/diheme cytochrome c family protein